MAVKNDNFPKLDRARFEAEKPLLDRVLRAVQDGSKPAVNISLLGAVAASGADATYSTMIARKRSDVARATAAAHLRSVIGDFNAYGAAGMFVPSSARAGDFLVNYSRGEWAERILAQGLGATESFFLVSYGPSTPPMPGETDYRANVGVFELITSLEGKRPDGLLFDSATFGKLESSLRALATSGNLAKTPEDDRVRELVRQALAAVEVKSSVWLARKRVEGSISVTVKDEEIKPFDNWQKRYSKPIIFAQVFFDSICLLNYRTIKAAIAAGKLDGFDVASEERTERKTTKKTYRLPIANKRFFADVPFPDKSEARFMIVGGANVAPYILYKGDPANNLDLDLLREAIAEG